MTFFPDPTKRTLGLDVSERVFRLVEIRRGPFYRRKLQLHRYSEERLPEGAVVAGEFQKPELVAQSLKNLLRKAYRRPGSRGAVVSLPETRTFIKVISVKRPEDPAAIPAAVLAEAELHIPTPIGELYLDWRPMDDPKAVPVGKPMAVTVAAAPKRIVDAYSAALESAGLVPVAFEIEAQSIVRSVLPARDAERPVGIIDFGAMRSSLIVHDRGAIQFTVSVPLSGDIVTRRIAEALGVDEAEAERVKRQCGADQGLCGLKHWAVMEPFLKEMAERLTDAVEFYRDHFPNGRPLEEIVLCGGGANMARLDAILSAMVGTPVRKGDPWVNIDAGRSPLPPEILLSSTTAVGLALRQAFQGDANDAV